MFGGPIPAAISVLVCGGYRLYLGGAGAWVGTAVIVEAAALGVALYSLRRRDKQWDRPSRLWLAGLLVHAVMLGLQLLLPGGVGWDVLRILGPIVLLGYPAAFLLAARIFILDEHRHAATKRLSQSESRYRSLFENNLAVMLLVDPEDGAIADANPAAERFYGWSREDLRSMNVAQINTLPPEEIRAMMRSAALTRQLLAFARKQTVTPRVLDLNDTIDSMLKMLTRLIGENVGLQWKPAKDLRPLYMDPVQIDQLLANLCVNARDAIGHGTGTISIETAFVSIDEDYCDSHVGCLPGKYDMLSVSDDDCGMDKHTLAHLFEPFYTTKQQGEGTGLGLATVHGIASQNEGFLTVDSEPGLGSTLKVYLPIHRSPKSLATADSDSVPIAPATRGHETILIVEDESAILNLARRILERQGYNVLTASTPGEAIRLAREHSGQIHLLLTDVIMPEMNGRDLSKALLSLYPDIKRIFMSGYTASVIAHQGVLDENVNFIQKPFSFRLLTSKVREALK